MRSLVLFLLLFSSLAFAGRSTTVISVNHGSAEQLAGTLRPFLSAESSISVYQNQLVVNATPAELAKTRELLQQLDVAARQLVVSLRRGGQAAQSNREVSVDGTIASGNSSVSNAPEGAAAQTSVTVRVDDSRSNNTDAGKQTVRATEGMATYIATGSSAPFTRYSIGPDGRRRVEQEYINAANGFYATTWVNNGRVRISIEQSNNEFQGRRIATQQLQSDVSGPLGEWLPIGVISNSSDTQSGGFGSAGTSAESSSTALFIKVELAE